jgi:hypothetical protein
LLKKVLLGERRDRSGASTGLAALEVGRQLISSAVQNYQLGSSLHTRVVSPRNQRLRCGQKFILEIVSGNETRLGKVLENEPQNLVRFGRAAFSDR